MPLDIEKTKGVIEEYNRELVKIRKELIPLIQKVKLLQEEQRLLEKVKDDLDRKLAKVDGRHKIYNLQGQEVKEKKEKKETAKLNKKDLTLSEIYLIAAKLGVDLTGKEE